MTTQTIPAGSPALVDMIASWLTSLFNAKAPASHVTPDDTRERREFITEMLDRHPDAMSSEAEFRNLVMVYPGRL